MKRIISRVLLASFLLVFFCGNSKGRDKDLKIYKKALYHLWSEVYPLGETIYCKKGFDNREKRASKNGINAEHVFPMSIAAKEKGCKTRKKCRKKKSFQRLEADLHNIYPARQDINTARSNYLYGNIAGEKRQFSSCDFEVDKKRRIAEPREEIRGKIARAILYMSYKYDLELSEKYKSMILLWDKKHPPTKEEKRREKKIRKIQGNKNKFITKYPFRPWFL